MGGACSRSGGKDPSYNRVEVQEGQSTARQPENEVEEGQPTARQAENEDEDPYEVPDDAWSNVLLSPLRHSLLEGIEDDPIARESAQTFATGIAISFMLLTFLVQGALIWAVFQATTAKANMTRLASLFDNLCDGLRNNQERLRIHADEAQRYCGTFLPVEKNGATHYHVVGLGTGFWDAPLSLWSEDEVGELQQAIINYNNKNLLSVIGWSFLVACAAWTAVVWNEMQEIGQFVWRLGVCLPLPSNLQSRGHLVSRQEQGEYELTSLSWWSRFFKVPLIALLRLILAVVLAPTGLIFIVTTASITDIILNSTALVFVLEVDTLLYKMATHFAKKGGVEEKVLVLGSLAKKYADDCYKTCESMCSRNPCWTVWSRLQSRLKMLLPILVMAGSCYISYEVKATFNYTRFLWLSRVCLYTGAAPKVHDGGAYPLATFPVAGLCESLTNWTFDPTLPVPEKLLARPVSPIKPSIQLVDTDKLVNQSQAVIKALDPFNLLPHRPKENIYGDGRIELLYQACLTMFASLPDYGTTRETDADLAELQSDDTVGSFACTKLTGTSEDVAQDWGLCAQRKESGDEPQSFNQFFERNFGVPYRIWRYMLATKKLSGLKPINLLCEATNSTDLLKATCSNSSKCGQCQGPCSKDSDCAYELKCFKRDKNHLAPGCPGGNNEQEHDYCYKPANSCTADNGTNVGDPVCCGQEGIVASAKYICPASAPKCVGFIQSKGLGMCQAPTQSGPSALAARTLTVEPPPPQVIARAPPLPVPPPPSIARTSRLLRSQNVPGSGSVTTPQAGDIRLVGPGNSLNNIITVDGLRFITVGRVEIYYNDVWGTVCNDYFHVNEARAVCKQLGYTGGKPVGPNYAGWGSGPIWLWKINCTSDASNLKDCRQGPWGINQCDHDQDVAVQCEANTCNADHGTNVGDPVCCSQQGTVASANQICPASAPKCLGFIQGKGLGMCQVPPVHWAGSYIDSSSPGAVITCKEVAYQMGTIVEASITTTFGKWANPARGHVFGNRISMFRKTGVWSGGVITWSDGSTWTLKVPITYRRGEKQLCSEYNRNFTKASCHEKLEDCQTDCSIDPDCSGCMSLKNKTSTIHVKVVSNCTEVHCTSSLGCVWSSLWKKQAKTLCRDASPSVFMCNLDQQLDTSDDAYCEAAGCSIHDKSVCCKDNCRHKSGWYLDSPCLAKKYRVTHQAKCQIGTCDAMGRTTYDACHRPGLGGETVYNDSASQYTIQQGCCQCGGGQLEATKNQPRKALILSSGTCEQNGLFTPDSRAMCKQTAEELGLEVSRFPDAGETCTDNRPKCYYNKAAGSLIFNPSCDGEATDHTQSLCSPKLVSMAKVGDGVCLDNFGKACILRFYGESKATQCKADCKSNVWCQACEILTKTGHCYLYVHPDYVSLNVRAPHSYAVVDYAVSLSKRMDSLYKYPGVTKKTGQCLINRTANETNDVTCWKKISMVPVDVIDTKLQNYDGSRPHGNGTRPLGPGYLHVSFNEIWGTVCNDGFTRENAKVACYDFGYAMGKVVSPTKNRSHLHLGPIWLDEVNCTGGEKGLEKCSHLGWGSHDCRHSEDVMIECSRKLATCDDFRNCPPHKAQNHGMYCKGRFNTSCTVDICCKDVIDGYQFVGAGKCENGYGKIMSHTTDATACKQTCDKDESCTYFALRLLGGGGTCLKYDVTPGSCDKTEQRTGTSRHIIYKKIEAITSAAAPTPAPTPVQAATATTTTKAATATTTTKAITSAAAPTPAPTPVQAATATTTTNADKPFVLPETE